MKSHTKYNIKYDGETHEFESIAQISNVQFKKKNKK